MVKISLKDVFRTTQKQRKDYAREVRAYEEEQRLYELEKARVEAVNKKREEEYQRQLEIYKTKKARYNRAKRKARAKASSTPVFGGSYTDTPKMKRTQTFTSGGGFQTVETPSGSTTYYNGTDISAKTSSTKTSSRSSSISKPSKPSTPAYSIVPVVPKTAKPDLYVDDFKEKMRLFGTHYASIPYDDGTILYKGQDYLYDKPPTKYEEVARGLTESAKDKKGIEKYWETLKAKTVSRYLVAFPSLIKTVLKPIVKGLELTKAKEILEIEPKEYKPMTISLDLEPKGYKEKTISELRGVVDNIKAISLSVVDRYKGAEGKRKLFEDTTLITPAKTGFKAFAPIVWGRYRGAKGMQKLFEDVTLITPAKTYAKALQTAPAETLATTTIIAGEMALPFVVSKGISKATNVFYKTFGKYVDPKTIYSSKALSSERGLDLSYNKLKTIKKLQDTYGKTPELPGQFVGVHQSGASKLGSKVLTRIELEKMGLKQGSEQGLFISPKGAGQTAFLGVKGKTNYELSFNPKDWFKFNKSKPTTHQIGFKQYGEYPADILKLKGKKLEIALNKYQTENIGKSKALITRMASLGTKKEPELIIGGAEKLMKVKTKLQYTIVKGQTVPIKTYTINTGTNVTGIIKKGNIIDIKSLDASTKAMEKLVYSKHMPKYEIPINLVSLPSNINFSSFKYEPNIKLSSIIKPTIKVSTIKPSTAESKTPPKKYESSTITSKIISIKSSVVSKPPKPESYTSVISPIKPIIPTPIIPSYKSDDPKPPEPNYDYSISEPTYKLDPDPTPPTYPIIDTFSKITPTPRKRRKPQKKKKAISDKNIAYKIYVRSKGVNKLIKIDNRKRNIYSAQRVLTSILDKSVSRSGFLIKTKLKADVISHKKPNLNKFRSPAKRSKLFKTSFVEKSKYAIDTIGEKKGITYKGILANLRKSKLKKTSLKTFSNII